MTLLTWKRGPDFSEAKGVHLTADLAGHTVEIHKGPRQNRTTYRQSKTVYYWVVVDGVQQGSHHAFLEAARGAALQLSKDFEGRAG